MEKCIFGAGCFWGVEDSFRHVEGVLSTAVGYSGGTSKNPTYQEVCSGTTGHAEVVEVEFDPAVITYEELLQIFWEIHDPTTLNRQGPDRGTQYRSVIFFLSSEQEKNAEISKNHLQQSGKHRTPVVTEINSASVFYPAEDYHQQYFEKQKSARFF